MNFYVDKLIKELNEEMKDPKYWSNNKRKMHGLPMRRKCCKKSRKIIARQKHQQLFFTLIEEAIERNLPQGGFNEHLNTFVDVKCIENNIKRGN